MIGAVDVGGTKIAVGVVTDTGSVLARCDIPTDPGRAAVAVFAQIGDRLGEAAASAGGELRGIGIGCTGPVDPLTGRLGRIEFLPRWQGATPAEALSRSFGVTAAIENDADAAALGEAAWGAGRGASRFICVTVGTGIGGGIVLDGQLYRGVGGAHPEIGHHVIDPSGPQCFCGAHGCWESLASGPALAKRAGCATAREACEAASRGDRAARAAVEAQGRHLGLGLANLITMFTPDVIALGGGVMQSHLLFWEAIHDTIRQTCGLVPFEETRIVRAALGADAGLIGAARAWVHRFGST